MSNDNSPATKADITRLETRLDQHDEQFALIVRLLHEIQQDTRAVRTDLQALGTKLLVDHERRLVACERRLGLAA
ncbi:MAG: hypothetical protein IT428_09810 [Planctomycetaceae bacterium]|nr:hypothetical protein [Planctomycetaceae bacterium]